MLTRSSGRQELGLFVSHGEKSGSRPWTQAFSVKSASHPYTASALSLGFQWQPHLPCSRILSQKGEATLFCSPRTEQNRTPGGLWEPAVRGSPRQLCLPEAREGIRVGCLAVNFREVKERQFLVGTAACLPFTQRLRTSF